MKPRARASREGHFDAAELTRRLYLVQADQKALADRKRRAREEALRARDGTGASQGEGRAPAGPQAVAATGTATTAILSHGPTDMSSTGMRKSTAGAGEVAAAAAATEYHHVPSQAAKQFARTTTVEVMREHTHIHDRWKRAFQSHHDGNGSGNGWRPATTAADDSARHRQTFEGELHALVPTMTTTTAAAAAAATTTTQRRRSTADILPSLAPSSDRKSPNENHRRYPVFMEPLVVAANAGAADNNNNDDDDTTPTSDEVMARFPAHEHRVDWSQSDEMPRHRPRTLLSPLLRKADSLWGLRRLGSRANVRGGSSSGGGGGEGGRASQEQEAPLPKSPRGGRFFAKFIR